jgi:hypothetical protein
MFLIFGISSGEKKLNYVQTILCSRCGQYGRLEVYVTYLYFSLFFIPIFKWNKKYYAKATCCHTVYELDKEVGKGIQRGENVILSDHELQPMESMGRYQSTCGNCGYPRSKDFEYCPKCGKKI